MGRYWFAAQPNLKRTVIDRANRISEADALAELERRLREPRERGSFTAVHICPGDGADVPDDDSSRIVIISPRQAHTKDESSAVAFAKEVLERRGAAPRRRKNMLIFAAADADEILSILDDTRRYLAWKDVKNDADALSLDRTQRREVDSELLKADKDLGARLDPAYQWLLIPEQEGTSPIEWRVMKITGAQLDSATKVPARVAEMLRRDELLLTKWSPAGLHLELDRYIWKDDREHIKVKELWEYLATYLYLPRLRDSEVLLEAIKEGTASKDYFGYATSVTPDGGYAGLCFGRRATSVYLDDLGVLVRPDIAERNLPEAPGEGPAGGPKPGAYGGGGPTAKPGAEIKEKESQAPTRFYGRIRLNAQRLASSSGQVGEEVLQHLAGLLGAGVEVNLDIEVKVPDGIPDRVVRTVSENAATLKFEHFGFEEE